MPDKPAQGPAPLSTLVAPPSAVAPRGRAVLTVVNGNETGRVLSLTSGLSVTLGRAGDVTHRIEDPGVSGLHARVISIKDEYMIADQGSTNGTFVNGVRVTEAAILADGDRVQIGQVMFRFARVDEAEEEALKRTYDAALRDGLTGVLNRKALDERLQAEVAFAKRHPPSALSVILLDIDHFKQVNDSHGHLVGDKVLRSVATTLSTGVRTEDVVARYGGEEFVVVVRDARASDACVIADRLRQAIAQSSVTDQGRELRVTASAGVAALDECGDDRSVAGLLALADRRLYKAKDGGRNRVVGV